MPQMDYLDPPAIVRPAEDADEQLLQVAKAAIKRAGESSWEAADAFLELSARGWTQQRIGAACGVSQSSVSRFVSCARRYAVTHTRPPFWEAYREVDGHDPAPAPPAKTDP